MLPWKIWRCSLISLAQPVLQAEPRLAPFLTQSNIKVFNSQVIVFKNKTNNLIFFIKCSSSTCEWNDDLGAGSSIGWKVMLNWLLLAVCLTWYAAELLSPVWVVQDPTTCFVCCASSSAAISMCWTGGKTQTCGDCISVGYTEEWPPHQTNIALLKLWVALPPSSGPR